MGMQLNRITHFIFDLDGCIYNGTLPYPGVRTLLEKLQTLGKHVVFLSNNSTDSSENVRRKLLGMHLPAGRSPILVATEFAAAYLAEKYGPLRVSVVGSKALEAALTRAGHRVYPLDGEQPCDFIVLGRDIAFNYDKLQACVSKVERGAKVFATNPDAYHIGERGRKVPETGAMAAALLAAAQLECIETVGKPERYPFQKIMAMTDASPEQCVMVGDNLDTDIRGGARCGMKTVWVSHGRPLPPATDPAPDLTVATIERLLPFL